MEGALVLPVLLLLALGTLDLGRLFYTQISLSNAAREAAKQASLSQSDNSQLMRAAFCEQTGFAWNFVGPAGPGSVCAPANWGLWSSVAYDAAYTPPPASPSPNKAYLYVAEDEDFPGDVPSGTPSWSTGPRKGGHLPVMVQIDYYWQPLTPLISQLLPGGLVHIQAASQQKEQY